MSMTQEEIEALMNDTASFSAEESDKEDSTDNIDDILAGIDGVIEDGNTPNTNDDDIDDILNGIEGVVDNEDTSQEENIDDILSNIDGVIEDSPENGEENIDDILANIDGVVDDEAKETITQDKQEQTNSEIKSQDTVKSNQIDNGVYPLPVSNEHQVVNQLNEVAEDSEEKASQIFDVLSFILDENDKVQKNTLDINKFVDSQLTLLNTLSEKFPNISIFADKIEEAKSIKTTITDLSNTIDNENNKVFEAMELMQYHDINRQKIERVMAVIRKLANYLNGIFSDDVSKPEVQIAKHISGDGMDTVSEDDLDSLIAEFNN